MSSSDRRQLLRAAAGAGGVAGAAFTLAAALWVETGASVGWASFNSDGVELDLSSKLMLVALAGAVASAIGALVGLAVGAVVAVGADRLPRDPRLRRLVARLAATWAAAALPLVEVVADDRREHSYTREIPGWSLTTVVVGTALWPVVWLAAQSRRRAAAT